ncbi:hypothetical protein ADIARSV_1256 [Arcticibacter svalbardensis MN12-7]|uniref:Uncharacterized protein n=2 Tax=Arcticibacter TaxID=1288026 RepID=R9GV67_9SPHI|nr:hypothetical protein ADIARSV_1256 [Arcticibacter svalbardensis MN12-7]
MVWLMIQFSTLSSGLYAAEDFKNEVSETFNETDLFFYQMIKKNLNKELKEPSPESILFIKAYSLTLRA